MQDIQPSAAFDGAEPGVYRCSPRVNGRAIWYRVGADGTIASMHVVQPGENEARIAARLVAESRAQAPKPTLRLIKVSLSPYDRSVWWRIASFARLPRSPTLGPPPRG